MVTARQEYGEEKKDASCYETIANAYRMLNLETMIKWVEKRKRKRQRLAEEIDN